MNKRKQQHPIGYDSIDETMATDRQLTYRWIVELRNPTASIGKYR